MPIVLSFDLLLVLTIFTPILLLMIVFFLKKKNQSGRDFGKDYIGSFHIVGEKSFYLAGFIFVNLLLITIVVLNEIIVLKQIKSGELLIVLFLTLAINLVMVRKIFNQDWK